MLMTPRGRPKRKQPISGELLNMDCGETRRPLWGRLTRTPARNLKATTEFLLLRPSNLLFVPMNQCQFFCSNYPVKDTLDILYPCMWVCGAKLSAAKKGTKSSILFCFFLIETFYFVLEDSRLTTLRIVSSGHQSISFSNDICFPHINHKALWGGCYVPTALQPYPGLRRLVIYHKEGNTLFT